MRRMKGKHTYRIKKKKEKNRRKNRHERKKII